MSPYLIDCVSRDRAVSEVFIVQESFASTAARLRDRYSQAVLSIDGSIQRISGTRLDKVLDDDSAEMIIASLGCGLRLGRGAYDDLFSIQQLRYRKIIIVAAETSQGRYIRAKVVSLLYRFTKPLFSAGHIYLATADLTADMSDGEFAAKVLAPATRQIVQLRAASTMSRTLAQLDSMDH